MFSNLGTFKKSMFLGTYINVSDEARNVLKMLLKSCDFDHYDLMVEVCFQKMLLNNLAGADLHFDVYHVLSCVRW